MLTISLKHKHIKHKRQLINLVLSWLAFISFFSLCLSRIITGICFTLNLIPPSPGLDKIASLRAMFSQFTWWTAMLVAVLMFFFVLENYNLNFFKKNKLFQKITSNFTLFALASYESVIMIFVAFFLLFKATHLIYIDSTSDVFSKSIFLFDLFNILIHFVAPIPLILFIVFHTSYFNEKDKIDSLEFWATFIYPIIYGIFYIFFAIYVYDPYPVTNLSQNIGWAVLLLAMLGFYVIILVWFFVFKYLDKKMEKKNAIKE